MLNTLQSQIQLHFSTFEGHISEGNKSWRPQTETATTETATDRNGHKPERPPTETVLEWYNSEQNCPIASSFRNIYYCLTIISYIVFKTLNAREDYP